MNSLRSLSDVNQAAEEESSNRDRGPIQAIQPKEFRLRTMRRAEASGEGYTGSVCRFGFPVAKP